MVFARPESWTHRFMNQEVRTGLPDIALCYGTRPQVIKASVLRSVLAERWKVLAVDTGQHYDHALNQLLYDQLGVKAPDVFLEVGSSGHAEQTAAVLVRCEAVLRERRPKVVVVIGDTNSTIGASLAAAKLRIPVVHVEAGLRARDALMAEEINRRVVDALASLLCAPSKAAADRLRLEHPGGVVAETGDVARDVLRRQEGSLPDVGGILPAGVRPPYALCTLHRAELTDTPARLAGVLDAISWLPVPVVFPMHPRTKAALGESGPHSSGPSLHVTGPVGYLEAVTLVRNAVAVITDSGGVQREAYWMGVPCITLREETEWLETIELGANHLLPPMEAQQGLGALWREVTRERSVHQWNRDAYGDGHAASQIAKAIGQLLQRT